MSPAIVCKEGNVTKKKQDFGDGEDGGRKRLVSSASSPAVRAPARRRGRRAACRGCMRRVPRGRSGGGWRPSEGRGGGGWSRGSRGGCRPPPTRPARIWPWRRRRRDPTSFAAAVMDGTEKGIQKRRVTTKL